MFKRFKKWIFFFAALLYLIIIIKSYLLNLAVDNGRTLSQSQTYLADLFLVLRYPVWLILGREVPTAFMFLALAINTCFYAFVIERIFFLLIYRRRVNSKST